MSTGAPSRRWEITDAVRKHQPSPRDGGLSATQRHLMLDLLHRTDSTTGAIPNWCQPSLENLAETTGLSPKTVGRTVADLVVKGWLTVDRPSKRASMRYVLHIPASHVYGTTEATTSTDTMTGLSRDTVTGLSGDMVTGLSAPTEPSGDAMSGVSADTVSASTDTMSDESGHGVATISPLSESSPAAPAAAPVIADQNDNAAVADFMERIDVTAADARRGLSHLLDGRSTEVRNVQALIRHIPDDELRAHVVEGRREDATTAEAEERAAAARERREAIAGCLHCDQNGWIEDPQSGGVRHCRHELEPSDQGAQAEHDDGREQQTPDVVDPYAAAYAYECPTCHAAPAELCQKTGGRAGKPHQARIELAEGKCARPPRRHEEDDQ